MVCQQPTKSKSSMDKNQNVCKGRRFTLLKSANVNTTQHQNSKLHSALPNNHKQKNKLHSSYTAGHAHKDINHIHNTCSSHGEYATKFGSSF